MTTHNEVQVKSMLTTSQKNFKDVPHPDTILSSTNDHPRVTRTNLEVPGSQCFLLHGLLSPIECDHYISETEKIGYSDLSDLFPNNYRSNDRVLSICEPLVDELWRRIEPLLSRKEVIRVRPIGFGNEGTWKPFRLNECCKFGRYKPGGHFSPHIDGPWVPREDESSIFTVVVYLNSQFEGGSTNFLSEDTPDRVVCSVAPRAGTALIFNHDTLHEGEPVTMGTKYIMRTEIMYRRVDTEMLANPGAYQSEENYIRTLTLYQKSWELEQAGDNKGFTDTYLQAIQLQRQAQRSISNDSSRSLNLVFPYEVYLKIFSFLSAKELCRVMTICKDWYDICMDGELWHNLYRATWPVGFKLEAKVDPDNPTLKFTDERPFIRDWYGHYKQRVKTKQPQKIVVLDMGSFSFKCAALHRTLGTIRTGSIESVVAMVRGVFDLHMRRFSYQRYYCGREAKDNYPGETEDIVVGGVVVNPQLLPEIIMSIFLDCRVRPKYSPVIILEPPGLWSREMKEQIAYSFLTKFLNPSVSFLSSAVATLCSLDLSSGVVVNVGHGVATCTAVWNGQQCGYDRCKPNEATPGKLADMVDKLVRESFKDLEQISTLKDRIVLTGGHVCSCELLQHELTKRDKLYTVQMTADPLYSPVLGGCSVANLSGFEKFSKSELECLDSKLAGTYPDRGYFKGSKRGSSFYDFRLFWYTLINAEKKLCLRRMIATESLPWIKDWDRDVTEDKLYEDSEKEL